MWKVHDLHKRYAACDSESQQQHLSRVESSKDIQNNEMFLFNWVTKREQICTNNREECIRNPTLSCDAKRLFHLLFHALFFHWNLLCIKQNVVAKRFLSPFFFLSSFLHIFFFSHPPTRMRLGWPGVGVFFRHCGYRWEFSEESGNRMAWMSRKWKFYNIFWNSLENWK